MIYTTEVIQGKKGYGECDHTIVQTHIIMGYICKAAWMYNIQTSKVKSYFISCMYLIFCVPIMLSI